MVHGDAERDECAAVVAQHGELLTAPRLAAHSLGDERRSATEEEGGERQDRDGEEDRVDDHSAGDRDDK
jgi:hypothetical protein